MAYYKIVLCLLLGSMQAARAVRSAKEKDAVTVQEHGQIHQELFHKTKPNDEYSNQTISYANALAPTEVFDYVAADGKSQYRNFNVEWKDGSNPDKPWMDTEEQQWYKDLKQNGYQILECEGDKCGWKPCKEGEGKCVPANDVPLEPFWSHMKTSDVSADDFRNLPYWVWKMLVMKQRRNPSSKQKHTAWSISELKKYLAKMKRLKEQYGTGADCEKVKATRNDKSGGNCVASAVAYCESMLVTPCVGDQPDDFWGNGYCGTLFKTKINNYEKRQGTCAKRCELALFKVKGRRDAEALKADPDLDTIMTKQLAHCICVNRNDDNAICYEGSHGIGGGKHSDQSWCQSGWERLPNNANKIENKAMLSKFCEARKNGVA